MLELFIPVLLAGFAIAIVSGPLGSLMVWQRMAYFGDTLSHSALLGVAFGFFIGINSTLATMGTCIIIALVLTLLMQQRTLATDTLLSIVAHGSLSIGLVIISLVNNTPVDLMAFLLGDLLTITTQELIWAYIGVLLVLGIIVFLWRSLLASVLYPDIAEVDGVPVKRLQAIFMVLVAIVIAFAMKLVGILLITALMIIPAATARRFASSPESMAILASLIGCLSVMLGLFTSFQLNSPTGPSIVAAASGLFAIGLLLKQKS